MEEAEYRGAGLTEFRWAEAHCSDMPPFLGMPGRKAQSRQGASRLESRLDHNAPPSCVLQLIPVLHVLLYLSGYLSLSHALHGWS